MSKTRKNKKDSAATPKPLAKKRSVARGDKSFSEHANRVADIILDDNINAKGLKMKKIADETVSMFKDVTRQSKAELKKIDVRSFVCDTAYGAGRVSSIIKDTWQSLIK